MSERSEVMSNRATHRLPVRELLERIYGNLSHVILPETVTGGNVVLQGCLPLLMEEVHAETLIQAAGKKTYAKLYDLYRQSSLLNMWYAQELGDILRRMTMQRMDVMILKGADLAATIYPGAALRHFSDIDIMVHPEDLQMTTALLEECGYHYHQEYRFESSSKQRAAFLYVKQVPVGYLMFEVHTSPHVNEMGVVFDASQIWARARRITVGGVQVYGMGLEDLLLYCCWHYRSHTFSRLIWLYDIAMILQRHACDIDWARAYQVADAQGLLATAYYCVQWCEQLFGICLPETTGIERFQPNRRIQRMLRARLSSEPGEVILKHGAYQERKWLQRLMVDDYRTLFFVLLRIIFPSPTHLGRLYMERSRLPLRFFWLYYFVHPFVALHTFFTRRSRRERKQTHTSPAGQRETSERERKQESIVYEEMHQW